MKPFYFYISVQKQKSIACTYLFIS